MRKVNDCVPEGTNRVIVEGILLFKTAANVFIKSENRSGMIPGRNIKYKILLSRMALESFGGFLLVLDSSRARENKPRIMCITQRERI